ncbi:hypothetical protein KJ836_02940 [Patescibacteria group bacterium]|nr:hypothetical protein [Patescibacteria group bacterium]
MEIRPIRDIFRVNQPDRVPPTRRSNETRKPQDESDQSDVSGQRQDTVEISKAYREAKQAFKDTNQK